MLKRSFGEANLTALVQPQFAAASDSRNKRRRVGDASIGASQGGGEEGGLGGGDKAAGVLSQPEGAGLLQPQPRSTLVPSGTPSQSTE